MSGVSAISNEGSPVWTFVWKLTTGFECRLKHGLDYGDLIRHEHVNSAIEIESLLRHFFGVVDSRVLGLSRSLSIDQFHACREPSVARCRAQLALAGQG